MNIQELAKQADAVHDDVVVTPFLRRFAALVLEEAAKVCDELAELSRTSPTDSMWQHGECAAAIRALKGAKE